MQSNFVALLNSEIQLNLFENWKLKTKKISQNNFEKPPPKPNYMKIIILLSIQKIK